MKPLVLFSTVLAIAASTAAWAQQSSLPAAKHQVGLIDMAYVFKNYEKFTALTESLQKEIEQTDGQARGIVEKMKQLQGQLTSGNLQDGSPDSSKIEAELVKSKTELETFKLTAQRDFLRKEADIYKTVYLEVENAVRRYSAYYQYTLVLRFNRQKVDEAENPRDIINGMNRQVVFFRAQDDLTDPILDYLNGEWRKQNGVRPATPAKPAASPGAAPAGKPAAAAPRGGTAR